MLPQWCPEGPEGGTELNQSGGIRWVKLDFTEYNATIQYLPLNDVGLIQWSMRMSMQ